MLDCSFIRSPLANVRYSVQVEPAERPGWFSVRIMRSFRDAEGFEVFEVFDCPDDIGMTVEEDNDFAYQLDAYREARAVRKAFLTAGYLMETGD